MYNTIHNFFFLFYIDERETKERERNFTMAIGRKSKNLDQNHGFNISELVSFPSVFKVVIFWCLIHCG